MNTDQTFPDFDASCILHEDASIVVLNKPVGIPSQAADPERPDDVVSRFQAFARRREGEPIYLGVHQRLDRETSGVFLMTRTRDANAAIAKQFESRQIEKTYIAGVVGFRPTKGGGQTTLRNGLVKGDGGVMECVSPQAKGASLAVSHVRVVARKADRALVEIRLETGRTHQARVQLAHVGAPIAGDALYGGAAAPRLLLHARSLGFAHPQTGKAVRYEAALPKEFDEWLERGDSGSAIYQKDWALREALVRASNRRYGLGRGGDGLRATSAFRLVNEGGDGLPGLAVDVYGSHLVAQFYDDYDGGAGVWSDRQMREAVLNALHERGFDGVYVKYRPKQASVIVDARREEFAPKLPARGVPAPDRFVIHEEGIPYEVRLADGLSTGIFLDQRENRRRVRELAAGNSVLNLFAYTCAFSVAAAVGGAKRTVSVDASVSCLERGRENVERARAVAPSLDFAAHTFIAEDVFTWLAKAAKKGDRFDLVIVDPPSYSNTKKRRFSSESDYAELIGLALRVVGKGGKLLACSNHRGIWRGKFRRLVRDGAQIAKREIAQLKDMPTPLDFPPALVNGRRESHLKTVLVSLGE